MSQRSADRKCLTEIFAMFLACVVYLTTLYNLDGRIFVELESIWKGAVIL